MKIWLDFETRSRHPIKRGAFYYSQGVELLLAQYAIDDGPVRVLDPTNDLEDKEFGIPELIDLCHSADEVWAHNAEFDSTVSAALSWGIPVEKWRCTAALARMHGLPGGLDKLSAIFKLSVDFAKDKRGHWLIQLFCVPRKDGGYNDRRSHPKEWAEFRSYADQDIVAMREVYRKCPKWNATPRMWEAWHLDQKMNARGVAVDLTLAEGAVYETERAKKQHQARTSELTFDEVQSTTQRDRLLAYLEEFGVSLPDLKAETVERRLEDEALPEHIKELLRIRQQASKASTAKYKRVLTHAVDGRLHNLLVFCGAQRTGRWAGRTFQPQNLPRARHRPEDINGAISAFRARAMDLYDPENTFGLAASCLRGLIVAGRRSKLVVSDYANVEGRKMAWLAGESWKLAAFRAFDAGTGPDLYKVAYARAFNIKPEDVTEDQRQIGKVCLAKDTLVVCRRGLVEIQNVRAGEEVWDGERWVRQSGPKFNGEKEVITLSGVQLTPDHLVWSEATWQPASSLAVSSEKLNSASAIAKATLPLQVLLSAAWAALRLRSLSAIAGALNTLLWRITSTGGCLPDAVNAATPLAVPNATGNTLAPCRMMNIDADCLTDWLRRSHDAIRPTGNNGTTTVVGVSKFTRNGGKIARHFFITCKRLKVGITQRLKWIAKIPTAIMSRGTSGLSPKAKTTATGGSCQFSSKKMPVYDLLSCGPKNRFVIWSANGPLIVHNCELALQYFGGVGAFCSMAETYSLDLEELASAAWPTLDPAVIDRSRDAYARALKRKRDYGLSERVYLVCQSLVFLWRDAHPAIVQFWRELDEAFRSAIRVDRRPFNVGAHIVVDRVGNWIRIKLPSGRYLSYPGTRVSALDNQMRFMGVSPYTKQWGRIATYNGKLTENIVQGSCADLMMDGLVAAANAGYNPVLSVHDEAICESPDDPKFNPKDLSRLLVSASPWAEGCPLAAKGFETQRYKK